MYLCVVYDTRDPSHKTLFVRQTHTNIFYIKKTFKIQIIICKNITTFFFWLKVHINTNVVVI